MLDSKKFSGDDQNEENFIIAQGRTQRTGGMVQCHSLGSASVIVLEQSAEALATDNLAVGLSNRVVRLNDFVFESLMIPLRMKMGYKNSAPGTNYRRR